MTILGKIKMLPLENKSVLVTRPKWQAGRLAADLSAIGGKVIRAPMIDIRPIDDIDLSLIYRALEKSELVIFLSVNAVQYGLVNFPELIQCLKEKKLFAIGSSTARSLGRLDLKPICYPENDNTSEGLLGLAEMNARLIRSKGVVVFRGVGGRRKLDIVLDRRGASVINIECYRRVESTLSLREVFNFHGTVLPDLVISTSGSIINSFVEKIKIEDLPALYDVPMVVVSRRLEQAAKQIGFRGEIISAENSTNEAILKAIENWVRGR